MQQQSPGSYMMVPIIKIPAEPFINFGFEPIQVTCPKCKQQVRSLITLKRKCANYCICLCLSFFGMVIGCCLIPLLSRKCLDNHHSCPNCNKMLGIFKPIHSKHEQSIINLMNVQENDLQPNQN